MSSPRKRETKIGYDFHGLKAHVSRCLLRQLCKRIVTGSTLSSLQEEAEHHGAVPTSRAHHIQRFYGALIFVDISGFTALSTKLDIESLTTHINGYFRDMLAIVESYGGDVVKFAGDAMYIIWHARSFDERQRAVLKAVACAKEIIKKCNNRTVPLSPTQLLSSETILKRVALTQSLLSGQAALDREYDPNSDSYDDEDLTTSIHCHDTTGTLVSDDLASQESPRSPRVTSHRRRNSMSSHSIKSNSRRLSFPSFMNNKESNDSQDLEVASLNVHIGAAVGILAGIDVAARGRSEFFLTGQPLLDVAAAESLAKLGQIVVSRGVYDFLKQNKDLHNNYECVSAELDCYRITEPIVLSYRELELQYGPAADVKRELAHILSISSGFREEYSQRTILLKCLSSHVHEAARMQSPSYSRCNTPPSAVTPEGGSVSSTQDDVEDESGFSSVYSSTHSDDSFDLDLNELGVKKELLANTSFKFERKISFDGGMTPDVSLSAELRELVILFIKIEIDVSLTHSCAKSPSTDSLSPSPARSPCSVNRSTTDDSSVENFKVDNFGFLERSSADEAADIVLRERFQECMTILADAFAEHGGQIGQYSCCEKGNVCLGTFGLRGSVQEDNAAAAIESAQTILVRLQAIGLDASIGVTSGKVYSGLVGSPSRHEYSIMGPAANLSSRLMCAAAVGTILSDNVTRNRDRSHLFLDMPKINAKGYSEPVRTYQPVMSDTFRRRLYSRKGSMDSCNEAYKLRPITDDPDVFGMMALDKLSMARSPDTFLYGRNPELSSVTQFLLSQDTTVKNFLQMEPVRIAIVTGACGCGKTCFLAAVRDIVAKDDEFVQSRDKGVDQIFSGGSNSYDTTVPFNSWRPVLTALIAAVSKNKKSLAAESDSNKYAPSGRFSCLTTFSPIETGPRIASFSPLGRFDMEKNLECATHSKPPSPVHVPSFTAPAHFEGCTNSPSAPGTSLNSPRPNDPRYNHLRAGSLLIAEALPQQILSHLHIVLKILPSFSKALKGAPKAEPHLTGAVKLQKTVVVLAAIIQTAVELLGTRRIFITLDDVQSMDPSSWNLLIHIWRENTAVSILASFNSMSRSSARGKVTGDAGEIEFNDFDNPERCKVVPLRALDKHSVSQLVGRMLETSEFSNSQIAIITEAAVDLAGGNPLFAREVTISAVETFKHSVMPNIDSAFDTEAYEEATLSHVINTLRPRHRIEEIISLRFDRLSPSYQLVLKLASVVGKDGASFTAEIISHLVKELSCVTNAPAERNGASKSGKSGSKQVRVDSLAIVNLSSINVEETLKTILNSNEFIRLVDRSANSIYSPLNQAVGVVKYKFINVLIKKSIYDLMLNHQKLWSHQKVAEYLEAQALVRVSLVRFKPMEDSDDEFEDAESTSREGSAEGSAGSGRSGSDWRLQSLRGKEMGTIADWNMLGVHWRLCNNFIKAMACFYESGHLVDSQGDSETARLLWTEAYEILCLMRKDSKYIRDYPNHPSSEKTPPNSARGDRDKELGAAIFLRHLEQEAGSAQDWEGEPLTPTGKQISLGPVGSIDDKSINGETPQFASECVYHVFKGDSLALEVAVTLIIRLSQNVLMFEEQPEDVVNLNNEALELVSCTRKALLEKDAVTFIHVPRLSPTLFLKNSCLLGPVGGARERRQSITLKDGKRLFCLRDPSIIFPVLSGLCMRYLGNLLPDDKNHSSWAKICDTYLVTAKESKIPVHIVRALSLKSLLCYCRNDYMGASDTVDMMDKLYNYNIHSEQLIHIYGADRALMQYSFGAISCIMLGDFRRSLHMVNKTEEYIGSLSHLQSVLTTSMLQFNVHLLLQMYEMAHIGFIGLLSFLSFNGGHHNMFHLYIPLFAELGKRLGIALPETIPSSAASSPFAGATRRGSATSLIGSVVSDLDVTVDMGALGDRELESLGYNSAFSYKRLLESSRECNCATSDAKKNPVPIILALRYGKGVELVSAELCLLEAKRLLLEGDAYQSTMRVPFSAIVEERSCSKSFDSNIGGSSVWRSAGDKNDSIEAEMDDMNSLQEEMGLITGPSFEETCASGSAKDFCEAGLRFIDFTLEYYPIYDSTLNSLQCYVLKAEILVTLSKIQDSYRTGNRLSPTSKSMSTRQQNDLHKEADKCLCCAIELGVINNFKLPILLAGTAFVQLNIDVEKGKRLIEEFLLYIVNQDKHPNDTVIDVRTALLHSGEEYDWINNFPALVLAKSILFNP